MSVCLNKIYFYQRSIYPVLISDKKFVLVQASLYTGISLSKKKIGKMSINNWFWLNYKITLLLMTYTTVSANKWVKNIFYVNFFGINSQFNVPETLQKLANYCGQIWLISFIYSPLFNNLLKTYLSSQLITALLIYKSIC